MTQKDLDFIKDAFSQIIDDISGNPDWHEAARAVASDLRTLERELEEKVISLPSNLDEAAIDAAQLDMQDRQIMEATNDERQRYSRIFRRGFKSGAEWMAEQGFIQECIYIEMFQRAIGDMVNIVFPFKKLNVKDQDKVIVQVRKKD